MYIYIYIIKYLNKNLKIFPKNFFTLEIHFYKKTNKNY